MISITTIGVLVLIITLMSIGIIMRYIANAVMTFLLFMIVVAGLIYLGIDELIKHFH